VEELKVPVLDEVEEEERNIGNERERREDGGTRG
jgi:hypothetical protein